MSYERRRKNAENDGGHLESVRGCGRRGVDGERGAGGSGEGGVRVVASGDAGDSDELRGDGECHHKARSRRKAFEAEMAWLFEPECNPDAWMLKNIGVTESVRRNR